MPTKLQFLVRAGRDVAPAAFDAMLRERIVPRLVEREPEALKVTWTDRPPPRTSVIPFAREPVALLSVWPGARTEPEGWVAAVGEDLPVWSYRVQESVPRAYDRTWSPGTDTPGVGLLTVFNRKRGLDDETFLHRWHVGHSNLSFDVHPLWNYVRNVVIEPLLRDTPPRDAIVEEHFRTERDLLHAPTFFGGYLRMAVNMARVGLDIRGFIDLRSLETWLVRERHVVG